MGRARRSPYHSHNPTLRLRESLCPRLTHHNVLLPPEAPDAGVHFPYRDLSHDTSFPDFSYLAKTGFLFADGEMDGLEKLRPDPFPAHQYGGPVLITQLTHVRGGLVLFIAISRIVTDMVRAIDLCTQWSLSTRSIAEAASRNLPSPPIPRQLEACTVRYPASQPSCSPSTRAAG